MILLRRFRTYKEEFPLLLLPDPNRYLPAFNKNALDDLMTNLILELSDLATLAHFAYMARHTPDKGVPPDRLAPFLKKFHQFVELHGEDKQYGIPTVWFVGHFQDEDTIGKIRQKLDQKNLKYSDDGEEYDSFERLNDAYWDEKGDAELFVKFIHQATMIGIDLLKTVGYKQKLQRLGRLEYLQYTYIEDAESDLKDMERYLRENSPYYKERIAASPPEFKVFWENFTKWKNSERGLGSWPHFLFNICDIKYSCEHMPLKINIEKLFKGW